MTGDTRLEGLLRLTALQLQIARGELARLRETEEKLRQNLTELSQTKAMQAQLSRRSDDAALIAGADIRWHTWVDQRKSLINMELAQVLAAQDTCRAKLINAFGRDQAAMRLSEVTMTEKTATKKRRAAYES